MSEESGAGLPGSGGSQDQDLEGKSIIKWNPDDVRQWLLQSRISHDVADGFCKMDGQDLANLNTNQLTKLIPDETERSRLFNRVSTLLLKQQGKKLLDIVEFDSSMHTRGTPVQPAAAPVNDAFAGSGKRKSSSSGSSGSVPKRRREEVKLDGSSDDNNDLFRASNYWRSMWNAIIENNVLDIRDAKLLKDRKNFSKLSKMYVRNSDLAIVEEILSGKYKRVAVSGTPGVGNTMLRNLVVYEIVQRLKKEARNTIIALSYSGDGRCDEMLVLEYEDEKLFTSWWDQGDFEKAYSGTNQSTIYHLSDISKGNTDSLAECADCCVAVRISSTNKGSYAEWLKQAEGNSIHLVSPVWSKDELDGWKDVVGITNIGKYEEMYAKFGGIPRAIFGDTPADEYENGVQNAVGGMDLKLSQAQIQFGTTSTASVRHKVLYCVRGDCDHGETCYRAMCTKLRCGTLWIEDLIAKRLIAEKKKELSANLSEMWPKYVDSTSKGIYMESVAHRLIMYGGEFNVKLLGGEKKRSLPDGEKPLKLPGLDQWMFVRNQDDMATKVVDLLRAGQDGYVRPTTSNFPAIDAVLVLGRTKPQKVLQLQMTVSNRHPIDGKDNHKAIQEVLDVAVSSKAKSYLVFVIPNARFNGFKKQKIGGNGSAQEIIQYSLDIESSLSQAGS